MSPPAIEIRDLRKVYTHGDPAVEAVDDVDLVVHEGEVVGLLGPNGAGKTTLIKCICGLVFPTHGSIRLQGVELTGAVHRAATLVAAILEGNRNLYWRLTPRENVFFFARLQGRGGRHLRREADELLGRLGLEEKMDTPVMKLSRGMQQRVAIASALIKQTPILIFDEPTLGLDVQSSTDLRRMLRDLVDHHSRTVVLSSHDMNVVQDVCDRVVIMNRGRIIADDRVENLLELFRGRTYRFEAEGELGEDRVESLRKRYTNLTVERSNRRTVVEVEILNPEDLYELIDILRAEGAVIQSIDRRDPGLEKVFLKILGGDTA